jgi:hypothetical protein
MEIVSMKGAREKVINRFLCAKTNTQLLHQQEKFYNILLHEDFYTILFEKSSHFPFEKNISNVPSDIFFRKKKIFRKKFFSFLKVKNIISKFRCKQFNEIKQSILYHNRFSNFHNFREQKKVFQITKNFVSRSISTIELVFESIALILLVSQLKKRILNDFSLNIDSRFSISIHRPLEFFEKQWQYSSFGFQGEICFLFHPEILIRILRKNCQDVSFLHLIRKLMHLHWYSAENGLIYLYSNKIRTILWNLYALEIDNFFVSRCYSHSLFYTKIFPNINSSISFFQKINDWTDCVKKKKYSKQAIEKIANLSYKVHSHWNGWNNTVGISFSFLAQSFPYKYVRSNKTWFVFFQKHKPLTFLLSRSITEFFLRRLGYTWKQTTKRLIITSLNSQVESNSSFFLAYFLHFNKQKSWIRINTRFFFLTSSFLRKIVSFITPFDLIVFILSKYNFCSIRGFPISKSSWLIWTDKEIIQHFSRIKGSFFLYYSACQNLKATYRVQYILYLSCCKTLASKHKANIRPLFLKMGKNLQIQDFSLFSSSYSSTNLRLHFLYKNVKKNRIWDFNITNMDSFLVLIEKFYNKF